MQKIIIGVDGSENSQAALRWALDHSGTGDELAAVYAWQFPVFPGAEVSIFDPAKFEQNAARVLSEAVDAVARGEERARITEVLKSGHIGSVLIGEAEGADMLVVGSRGHGGFKGLLLGSISTYIVHHARCPTVVIPSSQE